jgi:hypothetical protein
MGKRLQKYTHSTPNLNVYFNKSEMRQNEMVGMTGFEPATP